MITVAVEFKLNGEWEFATPEGETVQAAVDELKNEYPTATQFVISGWMDNDTREMQYPTRAGS